MKTPTATAMVGAQTTINYQLKEATTTATETATMTATMMTMETKALVVAASLAAEAAAWQERGVGGGPSQIAIVGGTIWAHPPA